jgi:uncharacterized membrane protein YhiD involved in acid resistance
VSFDSLTRFFAQLLPTSGALDALSVLDVARAALLAFLLSLLIGYVYRITHAGPSYSQSTVHTMVIMSVVVALVMLIIGTNIARAFSLVGALSIIRFRNAVKESRDVAFYFLAMAVGMACGTGFGAIAIVFTLIACAIIYALARFNVGARPHVEALLKLLVDDKVDYHRAFNEVFYRHLQSSDLLSVDSDGSGRLELVWSVVPRKGGVEQALLSDLRAVHESVRAQWIHGHSQVHL